jgi:amidase
MKSIFQIVVILLILASCLSDEKKKEQSSDLSFKLEEYTIEQLQNAYKTKKLSIKEVVQLYIDRINAIDKAGPTLNSVIQINPDALVIAEELDKELAEGKIRGPMHGIPVLLKDNIDTHDKMATTAGSRALMESFPLKDSWVAKKLRNAGAVILGKANLSEWANFRGELSTSGWSAVGGQVKNPYILDRNPCGSSSGSGVAVSANLCMIAIGTETNGSIVCPSTSNGIVGIKPTVGLISRSGIIPISFTQDTPGPMARTVKDAAISLSVLTGIDSTDNKTLLSEGKSIQDYTIALKKDGLKGKRLGVYKQAFGRHFKVDEMMNKTIDFLKSQGAEIVEIESITNENVNALSFEIMLYEYKDGLNKYFASLGESASIKNLDDLIAFNESDSIELRYFNQAYLKMANEKGDLNSEEYKKPLKQCKEQLEKRALMKL